MSHGAFNLCYKMQQLPMDSHCSTRALTRSEKDCQDLEDGKNLRRFEGLRFFPVATDNYYYREGRVRPSLIPIHGYRMGGLGRDRERRYVAPRRAAVAGALLILGESSLVPRPICGNRHSHNVNELFSLPNRGMTCAADRLVRIQVRQLLNRTIALRAET